MKKVISVLAIILSIGTPLAYIIMCLPIFGGKGLAITSPHPITVILFSYQCLSLLLAIINLCLFIFKKEYPFFWGYIIVFISVLSTAITCFVFYLFILNLYNLPIIPPQR